MITRTAARTWPATADVAFSRVTASGRSKIALRSSWMVASSSPTTPSMRSTARSW
ncbi:hypothetical protein ACHZ98_11110 [Streptomyces sp. MAR4 CNY-716]